MNPEHIAYLRENIDNFSLKQLLINFNKHFDVKYTYGQFNYMLLLNNIRKGRRWFMWDDEHIKFLEENHKKYQVSFLTRKFNDHFKTDINPVQISNKLKTLGFTVFTKKLIKWDKAESERFTYLALKKESPETIRRILNNEFNNNRTLTAIRQRIYKSIIE